MTGDIHPVDELLRTVAGDPTATSDEALTGRRMLMAAMRAEEQRVLTPSRGALRAGARRGRIALVGAVAVVVALVAGSTVLDTDSVDAFDELALVAESAPAPSPAEGGYLYSRTVEVSLRVVGGADIGLPTNASVVYLLPTVRERWQGSDGGVRDDITASRPKFFDAAHEAAYYAAGHAEIDDVGRTVKGTYGASPGVFAERAWPTDSEALLVALQSTASNQPGDVPLSAAVVETAAELLSELEIDPALRAGVISSLGELGLGAVQRGENGTVTYTFEYEDAAGVRHRRQLDFDANANLMRDSLSQLDAAYGVPAGTRISDVQFDPVRSVPTLGAS